MGVSKLSEKSELILYQVIVNYTKDWSTWFKTSLQGIMGKTDKYSVFMCWVLFVFHFWERKKRTQGKVAEKREALNAFKFRPVF